MTQTSHTPGPWDICESNNSNFIHVETHLSNPSGAGEQICTVNKGSRDQRLANARLIAAAPELLEALQSVQGLVAYLATTVEPNDEYDEMLGPKLPALKAQIDAAIAKAVGND